MSDSRDDERPSREPDRRPSADQAAPEQASDAKPLALPEALSAALSARLDGELDRADRDALDRADPEPLAARAAAFESVDASLRALAESGGLSDQRLREGFEGLRSRLTETPDELRGAPDREGPQPPPATRDGRADESEPGPPRGDRVRRGRRRFAPVLWAAAAALLLYLLSTLAPSLPGDASGDRAPSAVAERSGGNERRAAEQALALGDGEEPTDVTLAPGVPLDDLEIIEELELLEYLAARASEGRG